MKLCSYVVRYDTGFAPNPYWGYCTMACCKSRLRTTLEPGDWVVGTSSKTRHHTATRLVYVMRVSEVLSFEEYAKDHRFQDKIRRYGFVEQRGDNIYYLDENGVMRQRVPSHHSKGMRLMPDRLLGDRWEITGPWEEFKEQRDEDLSGRYVPIARSKDFWYYGKALDLPDRFHWLIVGRHGYKCDFSVDQAEEFLGWIRTMKPGMHGSPFDLDRTPLLPRELWTRQA